MADESSKREDLHSSVVPADKIEGRILLIRGEKVIIDADRAALHGVTTRTGTAQSSSISGRFHVSIDRRRTITGGRK
jgi:hypothetical protein